MNKQETADEFIARVKKGIAKAKKGEIVSFHWIGPGTHVSDKGFTVISACDKSQTSPDHVIIGGKPMTLILLILLTLSSCAVTYYTHDQVMDQVFLGKTKDFVITNFGMPDEKAVEGEYEQWLYDRGQKTVTSVRPSRSTTTATVTPGVYNVSGRANTSTYGGGATSRTYTSYVKLIFKDGVIVSWLSQGVDYSETVYGKQ